MADTNSSKSPLDLLRSGLGANSSANGDSITSAAASWLRLGPVNGPSLMHCLRQFTNVESLDGENMVGCSRCWKLANPGYVSRRRRSEDSSSSSSEDSSSESDEEKPVSKGKSSYSTAEGQLRSQGQSSTQTTPSDGGEFFSENTRSSATMQGGDSYKGSPIPSISTTSPTGLSPPILLNGRHDRNGISKASSSSITYLTPSSSRHGSIRRPSSPSVGELADNDSGSTKSVSESSGRHSSSKKREVRLKEPTTPPIPKAQRVVLRKAFKRYLIAVPPPVLVIREASFHQSSTLSNISR
jgi:ubiquitin carboxyl-terminal hydrolase 16/45